MLRNGQGLEGQAVTRQRSGSAGATPPDAQEATPRRASFVTYRRFSSTVGPQEEESTPGDPVAFRREDYLSRPSWLFDIGRYPVTLCPHVGDDGVPQKTSTGAPIYATEERNVRRPSWLIDTSQCAHIVHYGARRKSSTGAPYFVPADQAGRRSSELIDTGQFPPVPSVSTAEDRGRRKSSLAFATEDGHLHTPSWLDNPDKYTTIAGPPAPEGGRRPSTAAPAPGAQDEHLRRSSLVSEKDSLLSPQGPRKRSIEASGSGAQEEPQPRTPKVMDKYPSTTGPLSGEGAPRRASIGAPVPAAQEHHLRRVSWVADMYPTSPSPQKVERAPRKPPTRAPFPASEESRLRRLTWLKEKYPFMSSLHLMFFEPRKPKGAPVAASQEDHPPRSYWISDRKWKDIMYPPPEEEVGPNAPPRTEEQHPPRSPSPESSDDDSVITEDTLLPSRVQVQLTATAPPNLTDNVASMKTGKLPKPAPPTPFTEGRDTAKLAKRKYSAARETTAGKARLSSEVSKTRRYDLSPHKDSRAAAALHKATTEDSQWLWDPMHSKKGRQEKQHQQPPKPITPATQTTQGQSLKTPLMKPPASSSRVENKFVGDTTPKAVSSVDVVQLGMTSSQITERVSFDRSPSTAQSQTSEHLAARNAASQLKWGKAASPTRSVLETSNLQSAKEGTSRMQAAQATLETEDLKQAGTTLPSKSIQEMKSPQSAAATAVDIQAGGTHSTAWDTTVDKVIETKIPDQTASPTNLAGKPTGLLSGRTKELAPSTVLSEQGQAKGLRDASDNLETKEPTSVKDDSTPMYVLQTLHIGRVKLLPTMFQPEKHKQKLEGECDLKIKGINISQTCAQRQKPQERTKPRVKAQESSIPRGKPPEVNKPRAKLEELTKHGCSQSWCPVAPPSPHSSISSEPQNPHEWGYSKDISTQSPISQAESTNQKDKHQSGKPHKLPQLNDKLQQKRLDALRRISVLEKEIILQHQLQQKKQL